MRGVPPVSRAHVARRCAASSPARHAALSALLATLPIDVGQMQPHNHAQYYDCPSAGVWRRVGSALCVEDIRWSSVIVVWFNFCQKIVELTSLFLAGCLCCLPRHDRTSEWREATLGPNSKGTTTALTCCGGCCCCGLCRGLYSQRRCRPVPSYGNDASRGSG